MLVACAACGKRISDRAPACPFCKTPAQALASRLAPAAARTGAPEAKAPPKPAPPSSAISPTAAAASRLPATPPPAPPRPEVARAATEVASLPRYERGDHIGEDLQVVQVLGEGGFGIVYLVGATDSGQLLALKAMRSELLRDHRALEMFRKEAQIWIELGRHPNLVRAQWVKEIGGRLYLAMEYVRGVPGKPNSLDGYLAKRLVTPELALRWAVEFCHGMQHAVSRGIRCHRDIKPANILIAEDGHVRISDFGIAGLALVPEASTAGAPPAAAAGGDDAAGRTVAGSVFGTPTHMPPEQFVDAASCDERSDVYSFGVVLHQMATGGRLPFLPAPPPAGVDPGGWYWHAFRELHTRAPLAAIDSPLRGIVERCLRKSPGERYPSFAALRAELEAAARTLSVAAIEAAPQARESLADLVNRGLSLSSLGRLDEALACYDQALALDPREKVVHNNRGNVLRQLGRVQQALASIDRALELDPSYADAWSNKGLLFTHAARYEEAIACYERALANDARDTTAWLARSYCLARLGRRQEQLDGIARAIEVDPRNPIAWHNLGVAQLDGDLPQAVRSFERAIEANPRYAEGWAGKGLALSELGRHEESIACFDEALSVRPDFGEAHYNKGNALTALGRLREAHAAYDAATRAKGAIPVCWHNRGLTEYKLGLVEAAVASLQEFLRRARADDPLAAQARSLLARLAAGERPLLGGGVGERIAAEEGPAVALPAGARVAPETAEDAAARPAAGAAPETPHPDVTLPPLPPLPPRPAGSPSDWNAKAAEHYQARRFDEALVCAQNALRLDPQDSIGLNNLSNALFKLGRREEAIAAQERVLLSQPTFLASWLNRGVMEQRLGRAQEALRSLADLLELARAAGEDSSFVRQAREVAASLEGQRVQPGPRTHLGWLAFAYQAMVKQDHARALECFDRAIAARPEEPELWRWKASGLAVMERFDDALACLDEALGRLPSSASLHHERGQTLGKLRRFEDALAAYDRALEADPEHTASWSDRGKALGILRRLSDAVASLRRATELRPDHPAPWQNLAMTEEQLDWTEDAARSHREFLKRAKPEMRLQVEHSKARLQVLEGRLRARGTPLPPSSTPVPPGEPGPSAAALAAPPPQPVTIPRAEVPSVRATAPAGECCKRGETALNQKQPERALEWYDQAIAADPKAAAGWAGKAEALFALQRYADCVAQLDRALELDAGRVAAWQRRAAALEALKLHDAALESWEKGLALAPSNLFLLNGRGLALFYLGRHQEALAAYDAALAIDPRFALAKFNRAHAEASLGRRDEAARSLQQFLALAPPHLAPQIQAARAKLAELRGA